MKKALTSLDIYFLVRNLRKELMGSRIRKIKQKDDVFVFELYKRKRFFLKIILPHAIYVTNSPPRITIYPPNFCMKLRKHLSGEKIMGIEQHKFDRILKIELGKHVLLAELFSKGNLILLDKDGIIIAVLKQQVWKDRTLKPRLKYKYPPSNLNPFEYKLPDFHETLNKLNKPLVNALAVNFGFGGTYAEEICQRLKINKDKLTQKLEDKEVQKIYRFIQQLKKIKASPSIVFSEKQQIDVVPFTLMKYKNAKRTIFADFNSAVEAYFEELKKTEKKKELEKPKKKLERVTEKQKKYLNELIKKEEYYKGTAEFLQKNYSLLDRICKEILLLRGNKKKWKEIKRIIKEKYDVVKDIKEHDGKIVLTTGLEFSFREPLRQTINRFFEIAKKLKRKISTSKKVIQKFDTEIGRKKRKWYENYRWFTSSDGFLIVAGKSAAENEKLIRKHVEKSDIILHADIAGSPFVVVKNGKDAPASTLEEAAEFCASYSKAWKLGMGAIDVYWFYPEQLSKKVKAGEYLARGAFVILGRKNWLKGVELKVAVGVDKTGDIVHGPESTVKRKSKNYLIIVPGNRKLDEIKLSVEKRLKVRVDLELLQKIVPYGKGEPI